jgi:hypothetical protein
MISPFMHKFLQRGLLAGLAIGLPVLTLSACGSVKAKTVPVPAAAKSSVPTTSASTAPPTTAKPSTAAQYVALLSGFEASPAWTAINAQNTAYKAYQASEYQGTQPSIPDATLANITAETNNVGNELQALAENDSNLSDLNATEAITSVGSDITSLGRDATDGDFGYQLHSLHTDDVQARTLLALPLTGPGAVPNFPTPSA